MNFRILSVALAAALLAGCQTQQVEEMTYTQQKELVNQVAMRCVKQGYGPQSGEFRQCYDAEFKREVALRVRARERENIELANPTPNISCRSFAIGDQIQTRCN